MRTTGLLVLACWFVLLPFGTADRVPAWTSNLTLWTAATQDSVKPRIWINLAVARMNEGDLDGTFSALAVAEAHADEAPRRDRRIVVALVALTRASATFAGGHLADGRALARVARVAYPTWEATEFLCQSVQC